MDLPVQNIVATPDEELKLPHTKPDSFMRVALFSALVACGMALYLFWQNQQLSYQLSVARQVVASPSSSPSPSTDPTADWQTYENKDLNFLLKYPPSVKVSKEMNDKYNRAVEFTSSDLNFTVMLRAKGNIQLDKYYFMDSPIARSTTLAGLPANVYELPNGYCDGPGCSTPYIAIVTEHGSDLYHFSFFGDTVLTETENQILSTLKFTDQASSQPTIDSLGKNWTIKNPFSFQGTVPAGWMSEGQFPIEIRDSEGKVIGHGVGKEVTPGSWLTGQPVIFATNINFQPTGENGSIVLLSDNPSGLPENQKSFSLPIKFK